MEKNIEHFKNLNKLLIQDKLSWESYEKERIEYRSKKWDDLIDLYESVDFYNQLLKKVPRYFRCRVCRSMQGLTDDEFERSTSSSGKKSGTQNKIFQKKLKVSGKNVHSIAISAIVLDLPMLYVSTEECSHLTTKSTDFQEYEIAVEAPITKDEILELLKKKRNSKRVAGHRLELGRDIYYARTIIDKNFYILEIFISNDKMSMYKVLDFIKDDKSIEIKGILNVESVLRREKKLVVYGCNTKDYEPIYISRLKKRQGTKDISTFLI